MEKKSKPPSKKQMTQKRSSCGNKGGSVLSDMSKLAVPFGLIAAKNSLEKFIANRKVEEMKKEKAKTASSPKPTPKPKSKKLKPKA
jgi:hypothetical protein